MRTLLPWRPRSLSARVFWLTVGIIFVVDSFVMMPGMGREWQAGLSDRMTQAQLAAMQISAAGNADRAQVLARLSRSGTMAVTLAGGPSEVTLLRAATPMPLDPVVDLNRFSLLDNVRLADRAVLGLGAPYLPVTATFLLLPNTRIEIVIDKAKLTAHLRRSAAAMIGSALTAAFVTGGLVYLALYQRLVTPMRIVTAEIIAFRRDPEYARLSGLKWLAARRDHEISGAARELVTMQVELRTALWRNAQLAALGTAVAKISHDLRNILASALLVAERLAQSGDPAISRSANTLVASMERAAELVSRVMVDAGGQPAPVSRAPVVLRELVDEAADFSRQCKASMAIDNLVPGSLILPLDRSHIYRVLVNLLRNAAQAGASRAVLKVEDEAGMRLLTVTDDGPGLPRKALASLFRPFTGSARDGGTGLGLTIARDLIRAHGGDLRLRKTGAEGTEFVMSLPDAREDELV